MVRSEIHSIDSDIHRAIRKSHVHVSNNWHGDAAEELTVHNRCRFCKQPLHLYRDYGQEAVYCCDTPDCPNNPNDGYRGTLKEYEKTYLSSPHIWSDWMPKRLI